MEITTNEVINYLQLTANTFALGVAGWIYLSFIKNLKSSIQLKDEQIKTVEKNMVFLKDRISEMEKKTPENMEKILSERITIREEEIVRLKGDKQNHYAELVVKDEQLTRLKSELEKTKDIRRTMDLLELGFDDEEDGFFSSDAEYEIEEMGFVAVDSGQLMITDPCYIDSEWQNHPYQDIRLLRDVQTDQVYQFRKDFENYESKILGFDETVNQLIKVGRLESIEVDHSKDVTYSYSGACYATSNDNGYGVLPFKLGHDGAGIAVRTVLGDGMYPVYAEKYDGKIVRVYFNLL